MSRIHFKEVNMLIRLVSAIDQALAVMQEAVPVKEAQVRDAAQDVLNQEVMQSLGEIPVEELRGSKAGIRVSALLDAGYRNFRDLSETDDAKLMEVSGIGEKQTAAIRAAIAVCRRQIAEKKTIRLSVDDMSGENTRLLLSLAVVRLEKPVIADAAQVQQDFHHQTQSILPEIVIRNSFRWLFSRRETKNRTVAAIEALTQFAASPLYERACTLYDRYLEGENLSREDAKKDFEQHSAEYYILLEHILGRESGPGTSTDYLPADLAAQIDALRIEKEDFLGDLRAYQEFGVKYILHQKRVLLGDDMGLGKTVQAIAAMAHLYKKEEGGHILVICPASVLINWCREIRKFSRIPAWLIHGKGLEEAFDAWLEKGGAAVTNYEMMGRIIDRINDKVTIPMLVVDEAHYIKNPKALRTRYVRMLDDEAGHILMMTGTPLENRVSEMCSLIDFIRPDLSWKVREAAALRHTQEFREMISPVYLRRKREEVLGELPPVEIKEEWSSMTPEDREAYAQQILAGNFMGARRVSFLQEDPGTSSKAQRLKELCQEAEEAGRKGIVYSYFRETIEKAGVLLKDRCAGIITGSVTPAERQEIVDRFEQAPAGSVLICQVQAGGTGLNIQAASIVIFCEPQIKPSLTHQAIARAWRMGQVHNVQVYHLLCEDTVDEAVMKLLEEKQSAFDFYAEESVIARAAGDVTDTEWIQEFMEKEHSRYLPMVI